MIATTKEGLKPACGYVRMSSDQQKDSPERQRGEIERLAERLGYYIVKWFEDHGLTGTESSKRKQFNKMLAEAKGGTFKAVLLAEQSRFSREDVLDLLTHVKVLRDAGVSLATCQRGLLDLDDLGGILMLVIDGHGARKESMNISERVVTGKRLRVKRKERIGGLRMFGYDREILNDRGEVVSVISFRDPFAAGAMLRARLVVSRDAKAVKAVQFIFDKFCAGWPITKIKGELAMRGVTSRHGKPLSHTAILIILRNQTYCGDTIVGGYAEGKFTRLVEEVIVQHGTHVPIVSREKFEQTRAILASAKTWKHRRRNPGFLLTGIVRCGCCGSLCYGDNQLAKKTTVKQYRCNTNIRLAGESKNCPRPLFVTTKIIDRLVLYVLRECSQFKAPALKRAAKKRTPVASQESTLLAELADLRAEIEIAEERKCTCSNPDDVPMYDRVLLKKRGRVAEILAIVQTSANAKAVAPEIEGRVAMFQAITDEGITALLANDEQQIAVAMFLKLSVQSMLVSRGWSEAKPGFKETRLQIVFKPEVGLPNVDSTVADPTPITHWPRVRDYLATVGVALTSRELSDGIGEPDAERTAKWAKTAEINGCVRRIAGKWQIISTAKTKKGKRVTANAS